MVCHFLTSLSITNKLPLPLTKNPLRDVRVGNLEVDLFANGGGEVQLGCEVPPTCVHSTCPASHRCRDIWGDYTCECPEGFSGGWNFVEIQVGCLLLL